jgi:hypothetical protein
MGTSGYQPDVDGFDIHGATDLPKDLWKFLSEDKPLDACRFCLGYIGKMQDHHQLTTIEAQDARTRPVTRKTHLSKATLVRETLSYFRRRASEALTGRKNW